MTLFAVVVIESTISTSIGVSVDVSSSSTIGYIISVVVSCLSSSSGAGVVETVVSIIVGTTIFVTSKPFGCLVDTVVVSASITKVVVSGISGVDGFSGLQLPPGQSSVSSMSVGNITRSSDGVVVSPSGFTVVSIGSDASSTLSGQSGPVHSVVIFGVEDAGIVEVSSLLVSTCVVSALSVDTVVVESTVVPSSIDSTVVAASSEGSVATSLSCVEVSVSTGVVVSSLTVVGISELSGKVLTSSLGVVEISSNLGEVESVVPSVSQFAPVHIFGLVDVLVI